MKLHTLEYTPGSKKEAKRVGRGQGSGNGKTSGRGEKGQNARSGGGVAIGFEGGQTPLYRRLPKRGFHNPFRKEYAVVNLEQLNRYEDGTEVTLEKLITDGLLNKALCGLKVLGQGTLEKKLVVKAHKFSKSAQQAIENAGGKVEVI